MRIPGKEISRYLITTVSILLFSVTMGSESVNERKQNMILVDNGKTGTVIIKPEKATEEISRAVTELQKCIKEITGAELAVISPDKINDNGKNIRIHIGPNKLISDQLPDLSKCEIDGSWILTPTLRDLVIIGATPMGTEYGVYGFLQNYCGVRWYLPGENGKYIPKQKTLTIPSHIKKLDNPFFTSRMFSAPTFWGSKILGENAVEMDMAWFRHNRMKQNHKIHHSLWKIFHPGKYGKAHPEYYPDKSGNGSRNVPPLKDSGLQIDWQPCMSNEEVINIAAEAAIDFFDKNPDKTVFSLGVNDHCGFCRCKKCLELNGGGNRLGTNGLLSYSNLYFSFINKVAEKVVKKYPDRFIGCLAYAWCRDYPDFKIHPQVAVMFTMNSDGNFDAVNRRDMKQVYKYADSCGIFGIYTYLYGKPYRIPVMWTGLLDDFIDTLAARKVKWWYAETYQNWGMDGIKYYLLAQKLWDPAKSFKNLLDDFCDKMFDRGSSEIKEFFEICRDKWETQPFTTIGSYNSLVGSSQRVLFDSATCNNLLRILRSARDKTENKHGRELCNIFITNIQHSLALASLQERRLQMLDNRKIKVEDTLTAFSLIKKVNQTYNELKANPFSTPRTPRGKALAGGITSNLETIAAPFLKQCRQSDDRNPEISTFFEGIKGDSEKVQQRLRRLDNFLLKDKELPELLGNPSFENLDRNRQSATGWKTGSWAGKGPIENVFIVPQAVHGAYCFYFNGIKHTLGYYPRPILEMSKPVRIQGNKQYLLRAKMKFTRDKTAGVFPQPTVYIAFSDEKNKVISIKKPNNYYLY